jgi:single-stranded-DNA-specific exonuclease
MHPLLARLYAARGVQSAAELDDGLARLLPPAGLHGVQEGARLLADAIESHKRLCIVADYDCDGATACAVAVRGLRMLGAAAVDYLVPDRVRDGYGLTPAIAQRVHARGCDLLVTVDNGIASVDGVAAARELGLKVLVTDHHLPGPVLPLADALINPNQPECDFTSKCIAGCGVMFYVLLALRAELRERGRFDAATQPRLDQLLPLVALGTVADVVRLDANNRRLVAQGLKRIRRGAAQAGINALFAAAGRNAQTATTFDFGFALGPRINAAGRLADMTIGIECLLTDDPVRADELARTLDVINRERRDIEQGMREQALMVAEALCAGNEADVAATGSSPPAAAHEGRVPGAISVFDESFHEGVVGIVASRIKERLHRPTFVFAVSAAEGRSDELKGSGRSIPGFHLRDALDLVAKRHPGVLLKFGGHAMAAGCTIDRAQFDTFRHALANVGDEWLDAAALTRRIDTDGPLEPKYRRAEMVDTLHREVWGQGFAAPTFSEELQIVSQRLVADKHLSLKLLHQGEAVDGIWFGHTEPLPPRVTLAFRLDVNEWRGERKVQFLVEGADV